MKLLFVVIFVALFVYTYSIVVDKPYGYYITDPADDPTTGRVVGMVEAQKVIVSRCKNNVCAEFCKMAGFREGLCVDTFACVCYDVTKFYNIVQS